MKKIGALFLLVGFFLQNINAQYTKLLDFADSSNGRFPWGSLTSDGTFLYGMTTNGGLNDNGVIFKILPDGTGCNKMHDFSGAGFTTEIQPDGSLFYKDSILYGMATWGGANGGGAVFKIKYDGTTYARLHSFDATTGYYPSGSLISDGIFLYGTTTQGGINNKGVVFRINLNGANYTSLHDFDSINGQTPFGDLVYDSLFTYGMTSSGGANNMGIVFKIKTDGTEFIKLLDFDSINGGHPIGSLIYDGVFLYGMTQSGGINGMGVIFKIKPDGTGYLKIHDFDCDYGCYPKGTLTFNGTFLYGMTTYGNTINSSGVIFKIMLDGTGYSVLHIFDWPTGWQPHGSLLYDGTVFYGMTLFGGANNYGVVFKYLPTTGIEEIENNISITLYPNPASTQLFIQTSGTAIEQVNIYNTTGSLVMAAASIINNQLSIVNLPQGVYIAEVKTKEGSVRKRWVKMYEN